jgi:spermidine/putrescine transport system ATP-binding protein
MSDRIAVLDAGRIQQVGTPEAIYERPANLFVARFMGHTNLFPVEHDGERGLSSPFGRIAGCEAGPGNHVLIRPETLQLRPADEDGDNRFPARVSERLYRGAFAEYRLECGPTTITAVVSNRGQQPWTVGDRATLVVDPGGLVCLGE